MLALRPHYPADHAWRPARSATGHVRISLIAAVGVSHPGNLSFLIFAWRGVVVDTRCATLVSTAGVGR
jgi:hypothetical protein